MVTPTTEEIRRHAQDLYFKVNPEFNVPEDNELREEGFWSQAQQELMSSKGKEAFEYEEMSRLELVENLAHDIGKRIVSEADYDRLIDVERRISRVTENEKKLALLTSELGQMKKDFDQEEKPPAVTLEKIITEIRWRTRKRRKQRILEAADHYAKRENVPFNIAVIQAATVLELDEMETFEIENPWILKR